MKLTTLTALIVTATLGYALGSSFSNASAQAQPPQGEPGARVKELREKFDLNKDGVLDEAERNAARDAMHQKMLEQFDANKDGTLDEAEHPRPLQHMNGPIAQRIKHRAKAHFDVNKDEAVDDAERAAARETIRNKMLKRFDANGNGELDQQERDNIRHTIRGRIEGRMMERQRLRVLAGRGPGMNRPHMQPMPQQDSRPHAGPPMGERRFGGPNQMRRPNAMQQHRGQRPIPTKPRQQRGSQQLPPSQPHD